MLKPFFTLVLFLSVTFVFVRCDRSLVETKKPTLVVLSLDGFRWDYPDKTNTPTLDSLAEVGVKTNIIPSYPTKTFPNHYSMATGLYPDHHGIVMNNFYAPDLDKSYALYDRAAVTSGEFYGGEPIWNTAMKQGLTTATLFWVGSEAPVQNMTPTYWNIYKQDLSFEARIDSVFNWLQLPEDQRPQLIMWYFHEPDGVGHDAGPNSEETVEMIETLDQYLSMFFTRMRQLPQFSDINFIVTSDHGMGELSPERQVILDEVVDTSMIVVINGGNPVWNLKVKPDYLQQVYQALKSAPHIKTYHRDSLPARLHYGSNVRTQDLTVEADSGYSAYWSWRIGSELGTHGYDNKNTDMHAIFYAAGPAFKENFRPQPFANVDLYSLMADVLQLQPAPTDGTNQITSTMLKSD